MDGRQNDNIDIEKLYAEMAELYVNEEGDSLKGEIEAFLGLAPFELSRDFDKRVHRRIRAERLRRPAYIIGAIAASLFISIIGYNIFTFVNDSHVGSPSFQIAENSPNNGDATQAIAQATGAAPASISEPAKTTFAAAPADNAADATMAAATTADAADATQAADAAYSTDSAMAESTAGAQAPGIGISASETSYEPITLAFMLPPEYNVSGWEQDIGQTIFYIDEAANDNIVLVAERTVETGGTGNYDEALFIEAGLREITINDTRMYAVARADYSLFTFQKDDIVYRMTCKYDYKTIVSLCEKIL